MLQSGRGGAPLAPPPGFTKVAGAELAVRISELFRPLVTGEVRNLEGLLRLPGASEAEPGAPAGRLGFHSDGDGVQWITQRLGGAWGQVCLPLFAMAVLVGSAPAHPRTPGKKVDYSIGRLCAMRPVKLEEEVTCLRQARVTGAPAPTLPLYLTAPPVSL